MKNLKKIGFGLVIVAFAFGFSAFTAQKKTNKIAKANYPGAIVADYIVQPLENQFEQFNSTPNVLNCTEPVTLHCIYDVTTVGKDSIPDQPSYSSSNINNYVMKGWLSPNQNSSEALYQP